MYRTRHFRWKLMHILVILAHLGLIVAASITYVYDLGKAVQSVQWVRPLAVADMHPCTLSLAGVFGNEFTFDVAIRAVLMTSLVVVSPRLPSPDPHSPALSGRLTRHPLCFSLIQGTVGLTLNIALFALLLVVEPNRITLTEGEQHWRKQTVTFFGCLLNLLLAGSGVGLAVALGIKASHSKRLIAPLVWASIQVYVEVPSLHASCKPWLLARGCCLGIHGLTTCRLLAFSTAVFDAVKNYREGLDLLD
jgi:hypothetical protein